MNLIHQKFDIDHLILIINIMLVLKWSDLKSNGFPKLKYQSSRPNPALKIPVDPALLESLPLVVVSAEEFKNRKAPAFNKGISLKSMVLVQCCFIPFACMHLVLNWLIFFDDLEGRWSLVRWRPIAELTTIHWMQVILYRQSCRAKNTHGRHACHGPWTSCIKVMALTHDTYTFTNFVFSYAITPQINNQRCFSIK